jgi:hypothetical protein
MMFREAPQWIQQTLRDLSRDGYIYIGRTGVGLTYDFRKACTQKGTIKTIEETARYHETADRAFLELIAIEGPKYVSYDRIIEVLSHDVATEEARTEG